MMTDSTVYITYTKDRHEMKHELNNKRMIERDIKATIKTLCISCALKTLQTAMMLQLTK